ncbi:hypothetical protein NFI96_001236 [Prochilodus magdalenae]|nr:hypothetical protein NFI96_001236 [Prochilodus magdalenae]
MVRGSPIPPLLHRKIVQQYQNGVTQRKIAKTFKLSSSTVHNIIKRFRESGTIAVRKGQGRKTLLDAHDLRALKRHCTSNRNATVKEITEWAQEYFQKALSVNTIHRAIRRCQLKLYSAKRKPFLSKLHKLRRLHWARGLLKWSVAKWKTVLWSDESRFEVLYGTLGRHVIRTREDKDNPSCYERFVQKPASLMVKTGIYLLQDGNEEPFSIRLHLAKDILTIQEQDVICVSGEPFYSSVGSVASERTVTIRRQTIGGFGLSIKGGAEHKIPVVISKISKEQKAELSGLLFIGDGILQDTLSCSSWPTSPGLRWEKRWVDLRLIPLLHARLSQYVPGSDICRQNAFQVIAVDGVCSGVIQCPTAEECTDWLQAIASNISALTKHNVKKINRNFPVNQQIIYMGWVDEREQDLVQDRMYTPKFLALRGSSLFKFSAPPVTTWDWTRAEQSLTVYEIMCKILKDGDLLDKRRQCFSLQTDTGEDVVFSVELESELLLWEKAFQMATFFEVERIQCKTYACIMESHLMGLTIDFSMGFVCFDAASKAVLWRYKFSQLKGSSDDGKSKIKFLFQNQDTKLIEAKELEFSNLFAVLHCIHAFFAAKVACLDPMFVGSQNAATATAVGTLTSVTSMAQASKLKYSS